MRLSLRICFKIIPDPHTQTHIHARTHSFIYIFLCVDIPIPHLMPLHWQPCPGDLVDYPSSTACRVSALGDGTVIEQTVTPSNLCDPGDIKSFLLGIARRSGADAIIICLVTCDVQVQGGGWSGELLLHQRLQPQHWHRPGQLPESEHPLQARGIPETVAEKSESKRGGIFW